MARVPDPVEADLPRGGAELVNSVRRMQGRLTNFHRLLGYMPDVMSLYVPMQTATMQEDWSSVPRELRLLAHTRVSAVNSCAYCSGHQVALALTTGLDPDKVDAALTGQRMTEIFDDRELVALEWVEAVATNTARRDQALFARLEDQFTAEEIVVLTFIAASRTLSNLFQEALWTDLEEREEATQKGDWTRAHHLHLVAEEAEPAARGSEPAFHEQQG